MRIVFHTDAMVKNMGGSTISVMETLQILVKVGHEAVIIASKSDMECSYGITVYEEYRPQRIRQFYSWADVVFAKRRAPLQQIREYNLWHTPHGAHPIYTVYFASNVGQPYKHGYQEGDVDLVVFNTEWIKRETGWQGQSFVLHPPVFKDKYLVEQPGEYITQINLAAKKGGHFFWKLANSLSNKQFLGVIGKEKDQVIPDSQPPNVHIIDYAPDVRTVYARTKILLMPSQGYGAQHRWSDRLWTESYGRVGVEAAVSGIPVVAYPTPGIKEALGDAGIYCDMELEQWVEALNRLSNQKIYSEASQKVKSISEKLSPEEDVKKLESIISKGIEKTAFSEPFKHKAFFDFKKENRVNALPERKSGGNKRKESLILKIIRRIKG